MKTRKLSKFNNRRSNANDRERKRMHQLNEAFDLLRQHIPFEPYPWSCPAAANAKDTSAICQKISKIETLKLAQNYVLALGTSLSAEPKSLSYHEFMEILTKNLNQQTMNLVRNRFRIDNKLSKALFNDDLCSDENMSKAEDTIFYEHQHTSCNCECYKCY